MTHDLKVLIVEDDPDIVLGCEQALQLEGIATESAPSAELARLRLGRDFRGVVVSDIRLPKMDGMAFLQELMGLDPELPVVLITGVATTEGVYIGGQRIAEGHCTGYWSARTVLTSPQG